MIIITILLILILFFLLYGCKKSQKEEFKKFVKDRKDSNICLKPFRPTCNRDKIFSRMKYLEEKIDEIEYDIYKSNKKQKKYDKYFNEKEKNEKLRQKDAEKARKKAIAKLKNKVMKDRNKMIKEVEKKNSEKAKIAMKKYELQQKKNNKLISNAIDSFEKKKKKGLSINLSGDNEETKIIQNMLNDSAKNNDEEANKEVNKAIKELNMPPGFVF